jgi:predicted NBD/HSP70 family sugar kinase
MMHERLNVPFVVDNDLNLAALGHAWKGDARGLSDFAVLSLGTGIGAAVVVDGRLLKGPKSGAGEVGYMVLDRSLLHTERAHALGAFETLASGVGVAALTLAVLEQDARASKLRDLGRAPTPPDIFLAAEEGDEVAADIVERLVEHVAMAIINLGCVVDSDVVVLDGSVGLALARHAPFIEELAARHLPSPPRVVISSLPGATAIGAVAAALDLSRTQRGPRASSAAGTTMPRTAATGAVRGTTS